MTRQIVSESDGAAPDQGWRRRAGLASTGTTEPEAETPAGVGVDAGTAIVLLGQVLRERSVSSVLQPLVELQTGAPAGYEALARGPVDHPLYRPDALFEVARWCDRREELDALCRRRAIESARQAGLRAPAVLFVNVEPGSLPPAGLLTDVDADPRSALTELRENGVHVVAELTERALTHDPAGLLAFAEQTRAAGCGVALDDLGVDPAALALMPLLQPDVVKLDLRLVQDRPDGAVARTMTAVSAYAEAHEAAIVAEGVETEAHEATARSLGATHGQGWRFGRPAAPTEAVFPRSALWRPIVPRPSRARAARESVFALASRGRTPLEGTKELLIQITLLLERQAADTGGPSLAMAAFQDTYHFRSAARERFAALAERIAFVGALGAGFSGEPLPGVRGGDLPPGDPVRLEWAFVVVGPHFAVALAARDRGDSGPELDRRFDYVLTYDRDRVLESARSLLGRLAPADA